VEEVFPALKSLLPEREAVFPRLEDLLPDMEKLFPDLEASSLSDLENSTS
jgi:hypothetical protein